MKGRGWKGRAIGRGRNAREEGDRRGNHCEGRQHQRTTDP